MLKKRNTRAFNVARSGYKRKERSAWIVSLTACTTAAAYVWADLAGDLEGCSQHCVWNPGTAGSRLLPMRNQFQFRAGSPPAMPVAKAARLALRLHGEPNEPRSATSHTRFLHVHSTCMHTRLEFSMQKLSKEREVKSGLQQKKFGLPFYSCIHTIFKKIILF